MGSSVTKKMIIMKIVKMISCIITTLIFTPIVLFAQSPDKANNWYFGQEAGMSFQNGLPVAVNDGAMNSFEGTAVSSDHLGGLLFYTNGGPGSPNNYFGGVWNKAHQLMPNGDLSNGGGCNSSLQSSITVSPSEVPHIHYLFTTDCMENNAQGGLRMNIIDMNLDGGMGDVAASGILLTDSVTESLTAIKHANGTDYWIVAHELNSDTFHVFHLTGKGISGVTTSTVGPVAGPNAGVLKASANGEKLVFAGGDFTYLFNFDNTNGEITNPQDLGVASYTAEFSPNCKMLYVGNGPGKEVYQFNLIFPNPAVSTTVVGTTTASGIGSMQLGPDGKIYVARTVSSTYLAVINDPNRQGSSADFQDLGFYLGGSQANAGLPNFPNDVVGECRGYNVNEGDPYTFNGNRYIVLNNIGSNFINFSWNPGYSNNYTVMYRTSNSNSWNSVQINGTSTTLNNLEANSTYEIKVVENSVTPQSDSYESLDGFELTDLLDYEIESKVEYPEIVASTLNDFNISVFPNPTSNKTSIAVRSTKTDNVYQVEIYTNEGKRVYNSQSEVNREFGQIDIDLNELPNGIYQINVISDQVSKSKKLVLIK